LIELDNRNILSLYYHFER